MIAIFFMTRSFTYFAERLSSTYSLPPECRDPAWLDSCEFPSVNSAETAVKQPNNPPAPWFGRAVKYIPGAGAAAASLSAGLRFPGSAQMPSMASGFPLPGTIRAAGTLQQRHSMQGDFRVKHPRLYCPGRNPQNLCSFAD